MSSQPECRKCGDFVHWGPCLCEDCSDELERAQNEFRRRNDNLRKSCEIRGKALERAEKHADRLKAALKALDPYSAALTPQQEPSSAP